MLLSAVMYAVIHERDEVDYLTFIYLSTIFEYYLPYLQPMFISGARETSIYALIQSQSIDQGR